MQHPSLSLHVSWRRWVLTEGASSAGTPASPILIFTAKPYQMNYSSLVESSSLVSRWVVITAIVHSAWLKDELNVMACPCYVCSFRSPSGSVCECASKASALKLSSGTCMCPVCTKSWAASCLDAVLGSLWPTWLSSVWDGCDRISCLCVGSPMHRSTAHLEPTLQRWPVDSLTPD